MAVIGKRDEDHASCLLDALEAAGERLRPHESAVQSFGAPDDGNSIIAIYNDFPDGG